MDGSAKRPTHRTEIAPVPFGVRGLQRRLTVAAQIDRQRAAMWSQVTSDVAPGVGVVQLNLDPAYRHLHLRGIYLRVVSDGRVRVGDRIRVVQRGA